MRKIPATMATQHPDNAFAPYWDTRKRAFISVYQEINEAVECFKDLGADEYMWDWEGKHADAAVIDRLFSDYNDYFSENQLGDRKFLTFRIPNIWEEKGYNLLQAMTVILSSEDFARDLKFKNRPLFEVILPMTETADQLMHIHRLFEKLAKFKSSEFTADHTNTEHLELIPLVESVESQLSVADLLTEYVKFHKQHFGYKPEYIRAFLAGSDSALTSGFLAGIIGNKVGLARLYEFQKQSGISVYPIFGCGSLLFRGGLSPDINSIKRFKEEFPGIRTATVQSSFRYDHPKQAVKAAIKKLEKDLPKLEPLKIKVSDQNVLVKIAEESSKIYKQTLKDVLPGMQQIFTQIPKRRDRRQHIGLLAYGRIVGEHSLPRAITFTAGFYSVGLPPEFIGLGRALIGLKPNELKVLKEYYPNIKSDLLNAGRYINRDNLNEFAKDNRGWASIKTDVELTEKVLGIKFGTNEPSDIRHNELSAKLVKEAKSSEATATITKMAELRRSLG